MLYAREVIELMGAYPGRQFRIRNIVHYVSQGKHISPRQREAIRRAIRRALDTFVETGAIERHPPEVLRGAPVFYVWKSGT